MRSGGSVLVRLGDRVDVAAGHVRRTPRSVGRAMASRRHRRIGLAVAVVYLLLYLAAIGDVSVSPEGQYGRFGDPPDARLVDGWAGRLFVERAPFLYEPVAAIYPAAQVALFISPGNLFVGGALAILLGLSMGVTLYAGSLGAACRRGAATQVLGALPGFLVGFSCCVPTFILLLGTNVAAAILPTFIPLRSWLFPAALTLMAGMLVWGSRKVVVSEASISRNAPPAGRSAPTHATG